MTHPVSRRLQGKDRTLSVRTRLIVSDVSHHPARVVSYWVQLFTIRAVKRHPRRLGEIAFRHLFKSCHELFFFIKTRFPEPHCFERQDPNLSARIE